MKIVRNIERPEDIKLPRALKLISRKTGADYRNGHTQRIVVDLGVGTVLRVASFVPEMAIRTVVRLHDGSPTIYLSKRVGKNGKIFYLRKVRTMHEGTDSEGTRYERGNGFHDEADPRVTKPGKFIRKHDLDEIPGLTNVRKGNLSLVGPRPLTPGDEQKHEDALTADELEERKKWFLEGKPGVFNAPIAFARDKLREGDDKLGHEWNRHFAENDSLGLDLYIIYKTFSTRLHKKAENLVRKLRKASSQ